MPKGQCVLWHVVGVFLLLFAVFDVVREHFLESFEVVDENGEVACGGEVVEHLLLVSARIVVGFLQLALKTEVLLTRKLQDHIGDALLEAHRFELHDVLWLALPFGRDVPEQVLWDVMFFEELLEKLRALELKLVFRFLPCVLWLFG